jgi:hypothetical protein
MLVSCWAYSSTQKAKAKFQQTTWHCIPEDKQFITTAVRTSNPVHGGTSRKRLTSVLTALDILKSEQNQSSL